MTTDHCRACAVQVTSTQLQLMINRCNKNNNSCLHTFCNVWNWNCV